VLLSDVRTRRRYTELNHDHDRQTLLCNCTETDDRLSHSCEAHTIMTTRHNTFTPIAPLQ
jgi:hypothetical protein